MSKLRNVQFYRNETPVANVASHSDARANAQTAFTSHVSELNDGEIFLYRYTISGETNSPVHTITGVVRKTDTNTGYLEIIANTDMLSSAAFSGAAADVTYVNTTSGLAATNVQAAIDEVEGRVDTLESEMGQINAVYGVIINDTELTKDSNKKVTIVTEGTYDAENNKIATESTVANAIEGELSELNGTAGIASVSSGVVTLKAGVIQTDGKISNSTGADITLAKVATTGEAEDVTKSTATTAVYDTTSVELSQTWINTVNGNAIAINDTVDADINKLDTKIAGLADEMIANEEVTAVAFNAVKGSVGLENDFSLNLTGDTTGIINDDTNVKAALLNLATAIGSGSSSVKDVAVDGTSVVAANGVAGVVTDANSLYDASNNKIATVGTVTSAINALDVDTDKGAATISGSTLTINALQQEDGLIKDGGSTTINLEGTYDASTNKIATQSTVSDAIGTLDGTATIASESNGVVTLKAGVTETDGVITNNGDSDIVLAKVATTGTAADVTYVNTVSGSAISSNTVQGAIENLDTRVQDLESLPTFDTHICTSATDTPKDVVWYAADDPQHEHPITGQLLAGDDTMHIIYLVRDSSVTGDAYNEYITIKDGSSYGWEKVGSTTASLEGYVKTININGKDYVVAASTTKTTLRDDYLTNINTVNGTYITLTKGSLVKDASEGTASLPITVTETIQAVSSADSTHKGLAEASDVKDYVDTAVNGLDVANTTVGTNVKVSYEEVDGKVAITNVSEEYATVTRTAKGETGGPALTVTDGTELVIGSDIEKVKLYADDAIAQAVEALDADITSNDAAVATVEVKEADGVITDVVVTNISAGVVYNSTAGSLNLTANTATGAVTGADIAAIKGYVDAKAGAATLTDGNGIEITNNNVINVDLAVNSTSGTSTTPSSTTPNLLKIDDDGKLSISDTWDCGVY